MDYLEFITFMSLRTGPIGPGKHRVIQLDGDPLSWQRKEFNDLVDRDVSGNLATFAVEKYVDRGHALIFRFDGANFKFKISDLKF